MFKICLGAGVCVCVCGVWCALQRAAQKEANSLEKLKQGDYSGYGSVGQLTDPNVVFAQYDVEQDEHGSMEMRPPARARKPHFIVCL